MIGYTSVLDVPTSEWRNTLVSIAKKSYENNRKNGITGILIVSEGKCVQVIEGEESALDATFERIENDRRHKDIRLLMKTDILKREFPQWELSVSMLDRIKPPSGEVLEDFLLAFEKGDELNSKELSDLLRKLLMA
jgi:hypothetical protein